MQRNEPDATGSRALLRVKLKTGNVFIFRVARISYPANVQCLGTSFTSGNDLDPRRVLMLHIVGSGCSQIAISYLDANDGANFQHPRLLS
jgi:hypothetical protein